MAKGEETRQAILAKAFALSNIVGVSGLSIGRLAEATGLSKSGLFAHFGSKEALEIAVIGEASRQFVQEVMVPALRAARGEPRIRGLFENWHTWAQREGGCFFVGACSELDDRPGPPRDALMQSQKDWIDELDKAARIAVSEGHFRSDVDCAQFAFAMFSIMLGLHAYSRFMKDPTADTRARDSFEKLLEFSRHRPA
ncbi:MAG TPA: TetR/AcrR family transcriptional regulator [Kofleriaceae bacterium]|jgi:AcrR family transcriptional regulator